MSMLTRRSLLGQAAATAAVAVASPAHADKVVRVGYQKYGNLILLKASGLFDAALKPLGYTATWHEFVSGPPLMEALGAGAIDLGTAGETPPIFAQAAGAPLVYLGTEPPAPKGEAILVPSDSRIATLAELRGRKIAVTRGSNAHYLLVRALEKGGVAYTDFMPQYLSPPEGRAAFERGAVEAWAIWDPFLAAAQAAGRTRVLADATGLVPNHQFYVANRRFADAAVIAAFKAAIARIDQNTVADPRSAARTLSPAIGLPEPIVAEALARQSWAIASVDAAVIADQQAIADRFFKLGLIPRAIKVADAVPAS